jgi:DNA-binding MarR family transcriptional regulator
VNQNQEIYALLTEIYLLLDDGDRRFLDRFQLSTARFYALLHLGERSGISFSKLSELMLCDKSNTSRLIRNLEASELVYRQPHQTDGRMFQLWLTEKGDRLREEVLSAHREFNRDRFASVSVEGDDFINSLTSLRDGLEAHLNGGVRSGGGL